MRLPNLDGSGNEGVKRFFRYESIYLDPPVYSEPEQTVMQEIYEKDRAKEIIGQNEWSSLDELDKLTLTYYDAAHTYSLK